MTGDPPRLLPPTRTAPIARMIRDKELATCIYCDDDDARVYKTVKNGGAGHGWRVPGEPVESSDTCHCGHDISQHSFHVLFCRKCRCASFHLSGENYDDIHDRWN
jgi:hypothetical protein